MNCTYTLTFFFNEDDFLEFYSSSEFLWKILVSFFKLFEFLIEISSKFISKGLQYSMFDNFKKLVILRNADLFPTFSSFLPSKLCI